MLNKTPYEGCYDMYDMYDRGDVNVQDGKLTLTSADGAFIAYLSVSPR